MLSYSKKIIPLLTKGFKHFWLVCMEQWVDSFSLLKVIPYMTLKLWPHVTFDNEMKKTEMAMADRVN
jgi:hypothetical protein